MTFMMHNFFFNSTTIYSNDNMKFYKRLKDMSSKFYFYDFLL